MATLNDLLFHVFESIELTGAPIDDENDVTFVGFLKTAEAPV